MPIKNSLNTIKRFEARHKPGPRTSPILSLIGWYAPSPAVIGWPGVAQRRDWSRAQPQPGPDGHHRYDKQKWGIRNRSIVQDLKPYCDKFTVSC